MPAGVVIPTYREADNIASLIRSLQQVVPGVVIVIVDDSPDSATADAVAAVQSDNVTCMRRGSKSGRGSAVLVGMGRLLEQDCNPIIEMDADFSHDPNELPRLLAALERAGSGLVIASRYIAGSSITNWPLRRRVFSRSANWLARRLLRIPVADYTNGYRAYDRSAARTVADTCGRVGSGFIALSETLVNLWCRGYDVSEVPTHFVNRTRGESSVSWREIRNAFVGLLRIRALKRRLSSNPAAKQST